MSFFTKSWKFDGVQAAFVMRGSQNGRYLVKFEREFASLEDIEGINWAQPAIEHTNPQCPDEFGLPAGYGFTVAGITYDSKTKSYTVELQVADQFLGDVTPYQEQIAQLESEAAEKDAAIAEKEAAIKALEAGGTAEAVKADLQAAYTEGVESNG
ncbi:MAG TPA: hypothetical protein H9787_11580 [Candidatus Oscillibacter excrementigallinarum]|uniref:Uncharacterized protein n=1 Tax=Candidatus Oscillibacter excrementigallinarum TaxID=2838716 RepID=A0A9D2RSR6_9FIRM|nr:hypothetical protein [Candidatus Oscillibacter excrementigallinarum]